MKQNKLVKRHNTIINSIVNKFKLNNSENVLVDKLNAIVIAYTKDINEKNLGITNNNNNQALTYDPAIIYTKKLIVW